VGGGLIKQQIKIEQLSQLIDNHFWKGHSEGEQLSFEPVVEQLE